MTTTNKLSAAIFAALLMCSIPLLARDTSSPQALDLTARFADAGLHVDGFHAIEVGGIVVLRGKTAEAAEIGRATEYAHNLGYERVANVIGIVDLPDDALIERQAERALALNRALDGCTFHIDSERGVVNVAGHVRYELQKDVVLDLVRNIDGVREVHTAELRR